MRTRDANQSAQQHVDASPTHSSVGLIRFVSTASAETLDRENKIRIVEKLGYMKSALAQEEDHNVVRCFGPFSRIDASTNQDAFLTGADHEMAVDSTSANTELPKKPALHQAVENDEWLDDNQLASMNNAELEQVMDHYIMRVVQQLVQLAAVDDDLIAEIDSVDANGFSLLHYCCLYSLTSLIPVLLARGASINRRTSAGATPLHLAAESGNLAVTQLLVNNGAPVLSQDARNRLPSELAQDGNHTLVSSYLRQIEQRVQYRDGTASLSPLEGDLSHTLSDPDLQSIDGDDALHLIDDLHSFDFDAQQTAEDGGDNGLTGLTATLSAVSSSSSTSNTLLHEAFTSLSLTDKCALSLSIGQMNANPSAESSSNTNGCLPSTARNAFSANAIASSIQQQQSQNDSLDSSFGLYSSERAAEVQPVTFSLPERRRNTETDAELDMQSVLSETDKESLDVAMSMMDQHELLQVEDEVRCHNASWCILNSTYSNATFFIVK